MTQRVGVAEDGLAALGRRAHPVDVLQDPLDLAAGEVGGRRQPGLAPDDARRARRGRARWRSGRCGCPARRWRCSRAARSCGFQTTVVSRWLVMPSAARSDAASPARFSAVCDDRGGPLPDLHRVVLHPAGLRQDLLVLELVLADLVPGMVEDHEPGARGALVDGADVIRHDCPLSVLTPASSVWRSLEVRHESGSRARVSDSSGCRVSGDLAAARPGASAAGSPGWGPRRPRPS